MTTKYLKPVKKINWEITSRIRIFSSINYKRTRFYFELNIPISYNFQYTDLFSNTPYFNLCISWDINGLELWKTWSTLIILIQFFNPICICLDEVDKSSFMKSFSNAYPFLNYYRTVLIDEDMKIPGKDYFYIDIHNFCQFNNNNLEYRYIYYQ